MSCAETTLLDDADTVQEFSFDGIYAGNVPQEKEDVRNMKRQPKRRGLWHACFAQPLADEPVDILPSRSTSSQLRLTARQLEYRRTGSPEAKHLTLSDIRDVQFKWIQAGGVRVSKVTVSLESGKEPVVIRGLKNPEDLVDAVRKRQLAVEHVNNTSDARIAGRARAAGGACRGGGSDAPASDKLMSPQALFADAIGNPVSAATSGCGGMTLLSAFARIPAQDFAGVESVAREIQLASPRSEVSSYSFSESSDITDTASPNVSSFQKPERASSPALRVFPADNGAAETARAPQPPHQPSDSFAVPVNMALLDATSSLVASIRPSQQSPNGSAQPDARTDGDSSSHPCGVSAHSGSTRPRLELRRGNSPRAEDTLPEDESALLSIRGSHVEAIFAANGGPPPMPESLSADSTSAAEPHHPLPRAASQSDLGTAHPADSCKESLSAFAFLPASAPELAVTADNGQPCRLEGESFTSLIGDDTIRPLLAESLPAAGSDSSSSMAGNTRLMPALRKPQHWQYGDSHRLTQSSLGPLSQPCIAGCGSSDTVPAGPNGRSDGDCSSFESASSGEVADGLHGTLPKLSLRAALETDAKGPIMASDLSYGPINNALNQKSVSNLYVAATAATVSAVLTSAASASMNNVSLAVTPSLTNCARATAGPAASGALTPLSFIGLTAAAALTMVAAAAITHIRTGSPLRPWGQDLYGNDTLAAKVHIAPLLVAKNNGTSNEKTVWPLTSLITNCSALHYNKNTAERTSGSTGCIYAAAGVPRQQVTGVPPILAERCESCNAVEPVTAAALVRSVGSPRVTSMAALAAESSWCGDNGYNTASPNAPAAACEAVGEDAICASGNGEGSEDAITSGAWGSQPTLADFDHEHGTQPGQPATTWPGIAAWQKSDAEDALPVMLFSDGPAGMPPLVQSGEEGTAVASHQAELVVPSHVGIDCGSGEHQMQPAARLRHEGELQPPSTSGREGGIEDELTSTPYECTGILQLQQLSRHNSLASQLLCAGEAMELAAAPLGSSTPRRQREPEPEEGTSSTRYSRLVYAGAATGDLAAASNPALITSVVNRRRQVLHLTESPVRVLYSVHATFTGQPSKETRMQSRDERAMVPTLAATVLLLPTCDSAVQTEAPQVECAVQTEVEMHGSMRSSAQSQGASSDGMGTSASRCGSRNDNPAGQMFAGSACQLVSDAEGGSVCALGSGVNSGRSVGCPSPLQAAAQDLCESSLGGTDPKLVEFEWPVASVDGTRCGPSETLPAADASFCICSCSFPLPGNPGVPWSIADAAAATMARSCRQCLTLARNSQRKCISRSTNDDVQLLLPCLLDSQPDAEPTTMAQFGTPASADAQPVVSQSSSITPVMAHMHGQIEVAAAPAEDRSQQQRQLGNLDIVAPDDIAMPLSRSSSRLRMLSPSVSCTSGSVPRSASVGSGPYTRLTSASSSSDDLGTSVGGNILLPAGSAGNSQHNCDRASAAQACARSSLSVGQGGDSGAMAEDRVTVIQQRLLARENTLSAEPPMPADCCPPYFTAPCGSNSPSVSNAQEDVSSAAAEPVSLPSAGSDTTYGITWMLGPEIGHASAAAAVAGGAVTSAPDSPRIPLPPPLASSITTLRGGVGSSRRVTAEAAEGIKEKVRLAECCSSRGSSNGSSGIPPGSLTWFAHGQRAPSCSSAGCSGAHRPAQAKFCLNSSQLVTPLSAEVRSSVAAIDQGPEVHADAIGAGINSHCDDLVRSSDINSAGPGPSCGPTAAVCVMDSSRNLPFVIGNDGHDRSCRDADIAVSSSQQTLSSGASAASHSTMTSPELSDISSAAYAGRAYTYDSPCGHQASRGAHAESGARMDGPPATGGDDLFHNPLYGATAKSSPVTVRPAPLQPQAEESGCMGMPLMPYSIRGSICCGIDGNDGGTSTCTSSPARASASQLSVGTPSIGRRRTREESASSSYRYHNGGCVSDAIVEHGTNSNEAWRSWVAAAAIRCLASSGRLCSPVQMSANSRGTHWEDFSKTGSSAGAHTHSSKRARTAALKPQMSASASQRSSTSVLLRGLASPVMVLNPAYAQSAGGSPTFASPQPSTGGGISAPRADAMQNPAVGAGVVIQQVHPPTNALFRPRHQQEQQQSMGHEKVGGTRVMLGVFASSRMGCHSAYTPSVGGSSAVTSSPPVTGGVVRSAARVETVASGDYMDANASARAAPPQSKAPARSVLQQQPAQQDLQQRVGDQWPIRERVMLGVFASSHTGPHSAHTSSVCGSSAVTPSPSGTGDIVPAARVKFTERGDHMRAGIGAVAASEVAGVVGKECEAGLDEGLESLGRRTPEHITSLYRDLSQPQDSGWSSVQGSPSSNQAAHATALLRQANDAVDFAREAVQRGDAEWLSRVTATLQAVQSALDALREF
ncbi:hypothetical protein Vretimale_2737 [Volvox reticuliferus]|uniref:Uncharacterized protein n=1 Tax=Volvox reticuliferus TaxID=1737510 RepID=A0A8J4D7E1_9CHLO|nr:hypothetical protein Vretifemale_1950 [Volvox reticuliferus]GIL97024.1 hypothetical protein Vretimale_2737 [Volvox reticuliferus]